MMMFGDGYELRLYLVTFLLRKQPTSILLISCWYIYDVSKESILRRHIRR